MNNGLEQVKNALIAALEAAGLQARSAFSPGWTQEYSEPVVAVGLRSGESRGDAFNFYLGIQEDPKTLKQQEVYGMRLELRLSLDIYSPAQGGSAGAEHTLVLLHQVMLNGLPAGLKPESLQWEEMHWDEETEMFLRRGELSCCAHFTASVSEDGALLSDFILKGRLSK